MKYYYIQLFSPHGLIRFHEPEIGRDKDTGGQVKYVLEMLKTLSQHPQVRKIDLFTRRIADKKVSPSYAQEIEIVNDKARIVRIACGGNTYRQKETLWDCLDEFVDKTIRFIEHENDVPDVVHGHYADGNYIAGQLAETYGISFIATGHSLGRNKKNILLEQGLTEAKINEKFNMERRIEEEEKFIKQADAIVVSTRYIIETQYALYDNKAAGKFTVISPGVNAELFFPFYRQEMPSYEISVDQEQAVYRVNSEIERFLFNPSKPLILSIGRADKRKNFEAIIQAYGQDQELQAMANLAIFAGVRKDISVMQPDEQEILTNLLLLLDKYDLYGKMALPKKNDPQLEVPEIYRIAARRKGVFVNGTPGENFGLTIIEASSCGLPVIASPKGGPKEILENCQNGILVDVDEPAEIAAALKKIISDKQLWETFSSNGIRETSLQYTWKAYADKYIEQVGKLVETKPQGKEAGMVKPAYGKKFASARLFVICDIDGTLIEKNNAPGLNEFKAWLGEQGDNVVFGVASGRNRVITQEALVNHGLDKADIMICSAGSEIYYTDKFIYDNGYESHINYLWKRDELKKLLNQFKGIRLQEPDAQWPYKLSYYVNDNFTDDDIANLYKFLDDHKLKAKIMLSENQYLDILPFRSGKGNAVRYLSYKWKIPIQHFITAGNSGNDIDMLKGKTKGIVVANYSEELEQLRKSKGIYFAVKPLAEGVLEGIQYYTGESVTKIKTALR